MQEPRLDHEVPGLHDESPTPVPMVHDGAPTPSARPARLQAMLGAAWLPMRTAARATLDLIRARPRIGATAVAVAVAAAVILPAALRSKGAPPVVEPRGPVPRIVDTLAAPTLIAAGKGAPTAPALSGLDLKSIAIDDAGSVASLSGGRVARLTLDSKLQNAALRLLAKHKLPQAAIVAIEPSTGRVLAYASRGGDGKDLVVEATAPSASVFKIVTGAALVQVAAVTIDTKLCYSGGEQKLTAADLKDDPKHDLYCATLSQAMGRSINAVFAKLASRKLNGADLSAIAGQLGYGQSIPFDVAVQTSTIDLPTDTLGFARTAAGFWNTTLSPLHGALLAGTVANGGTMMRPFIVDQVTDAGRVTYRAPTPTAIRKAIEPATASALGTMMLETVTQGTSFKAFHDKSAKPFLPGIDVAGKTGTLNNTSPVRLYTWFVGYAPAKAPKIAVSVLVVNDPLWKVKANTVARELLQAYFHAQGASGVQPPLYD